MDIKEYLLTSSQSSQQCSACLFDYNTLNVQKYYRNGGSIAAKCMEIIGQDYLLSAEVGKPKLFIWQLNSQEVSKSLRLILPNVATCIAVCPNSVYLAAGMGSKIYIWHLSSGKLLSVQQKHYQPVTCVKFSSDGDFLLIGGQDGMLVVYKLCVMVSVSNNFLAQSEMGHVEPEYVKNDHSMPIRDLHVGHFGKKSRFATVSNDQTCRLYNLSDGEPILTLVFPDSLTSVVLDAPCWNLFVGSQEGTIRQYQLKGSKSPTQHVDKSAMTFTGHSKKIVCLTINIASTILASGSEDNFVFTWEIKSRQILKKIELKSPITNIKFVLGYENFFVETFKPQIVLKSLERSVDSGSKFTVIRVQNEDIELSDDENSQEKEILREKLLKENVKLRIVNRQLYDAALSFTKKYEVEKNG